MRAFSPEARARIVYGTFYAAVGAAAPYLILFYQHIGFDLATIGLVVGFGSVVSLLAGPGWGYLSDRLRGSPWVLIGAAATAIVGLVTMYQARGLPAVLGCSILLSAGFAGLSPILDARALEVSGPERRGFGPLRAWGSASYIAASFGTGAAIDAWGLGAAFAIASAMLAITAVSGATLVHRAVTPPPAAQQLAVPPTVTGSATAARADRRLGTLSGLRLVWLGPLGLFIGGAWLTFTGLAGVMAFYSLRYAELAAPATIIGLSSALGAGVEVPVMLGFPRLAARFGAERLVVAGAAIFTIRAFVAAATADPLVLVVLAGIGGAGYACFIVGGVTYVSRHAPPGLAATAQGLFSGLANGLGQVVAGLGGGLIASAIGITGLFGVAGVLGVAAVLVVGLAVLGSRGGAATPPRGGAHGGRPQTTTG